MVKIALASLLLEFAVEAAAGSCPFTTYTKNSEGLCASCDISPWYSSDHKCTCGPSQSDWITEDEVVPCTPNFAGTASEKYIIMEGCDHYLCPEGFEPIMDGDSCIEAASAVSPQDGCNRPDGTFEPWKKVLSLEEDADRPTGCYTYGACQGGCGLHLNSFAHGSNSTCGFCYSTSLLCKRKEIHVELAVEAEYVGPCPFTKYSTNSEGLCASCDISPWYGSDHKCTCGPSQSDWITEDQVVPCTPNSDGNLQIVSACPFTEYHKNSEGLCASCDISPWYSSDHKCTCGPSQSDWITEDDVVPCTPNSEEILV